MAVLGNSLPAPECKRQGLGHIRFCLVMRTISFLFILSVAAVSALGCFGSHEKGGFVDAGCDGGQGCGQADEAGVKDTPEPRSGGLGGSSETGGLEGSNETGGSGGLDSADGESGRSGTANGGSTDGSGGADRPDANGAGWSAGTGEGVRAICAPGTDSDGDRNHQLTGHVEDEFATRIPDITVRALDNETATVLYDETVSDEVGGFTLTGLPNGEICVMAVGDYTQDPRRNDTYTCNVPSDSRDLTILSSDASLVEIVTGLLCCDHSRTGIVTGAVYYYDEACEEQLVGCAHVEADVASTMFYFDGSLPSTTRTSTDPNSGRFLMIHVDPGMVTVTATLANGKSGSTTIPVFAGEDATGGDYSMHVAKVYIEGLGNPNPECSN